MSSAADPPFSPRPRAAQASGRPGPAAGEVILHYIILCYAILIQY